MDSKEYAVSLGDVCTKIGSGATPRGGKDSYKVSGIALIRSQNVIDWSFTDSGLAFIDDEQAAKLSSVAVEPGDVLLNITGDSVARACVVPTDHLPARVNQHVMIIRPDKSKLTSMFLLAFLQMQKPLLLKLASAGATRNALTKSIVAGLEIYLPPLEEQLRISKLLADIQAKIAQNNKTNDYLFESCMAKMHDIAKASDGVMKVDDCCESIYSGGTPSTKNPAYWDGSLPWLSSGETRNRFIIDTEKTITELGVAESSTKLAKAGDVVMASAGQGFTRGQTSMLFFDTYVNQSVVVMRPKKNYGTYLLLILAAQYDSLRAWSDSTSTRGSMSGKLLKQFKLPYINPCQAQELTEFALPLFSMIENNMRESKALSQIRDALLSKLMSGKIDVSRIELP